MLLCVSCLRKRTNFGGFRSFHFINLPKSVLLSFGGDGFRTRGPLLIALLDCVVSVVSGHSSFRARDRRPDSPLRGWLLLRYRFRIFVQKRMLYCENVLAAKSRVFCDTLFKLKTR